MSHDTTSPDVATPTTEKPRVRLHGLDALRGGALLLGIVLHALMPFMPGMPWLVNDPQPSEAVMPVIFVIHLFRMVVFMMLAGYFGAMVLGRRGPWRYLKDRLVRILLPAVVFWPVAVGSLALLAVFGSVWREVPPPPAPPGAMNDPLMAITPGQLWFLWTLMECVVITLVVRAIALRILGADRIGRAMAWTGALLATPAGVLIDAIPYFTGLWLQGYLLGGIVAPVTIRPELSSLIPYLGAFAVGWALHASPAALQKISNRWIGYLVIAVIVTVISWFTEGGEALPLPVGAALIAIAGWMWTYGLLGLCVRHLHRERPFVRYLADASYWAYLLHLPLLVFGEILVADLPWPALLKIVVVLGATSIVLLVSYHLLVRSTPIGRWLNGRRYPFRWTLG